MRFKYALVAVAAVIVATATVSAAVLPTAPRPTVVTPGVWTPLALTQVDFPAGVTMDAEAVLVIRTQAEYTAFVDALAAPRGGTDFPTVDFSNSFLVVASNGFKDLGNGLEVAGAKSNGERVVVTVEKQVDNPDHCRITHKVEFQGQFAVISKPSVADFTTTEVGIANQVSTIPYDPYYNCGCPEM